MTLEQGKLCVNNLKQAIGTVQMSNEGKKSGAKLQPSLKAAEDFLTLHVSLINHIKRLLKRLFDLTE
jgi:hypothetical protein